MQGAFLVCVCVVGGGGEGRLDVLNEISQRDGIVCLKLCVSLVSKLKCTIT